MSWADGLVRDASSAGTRAGVFAAGSKGGWVLVWAMGRELRLRNERRASRARNDREIVGAGMPAGGGMAAVRAECGRRVWRIDSFVLRRIAQRQGEQHGFADGVGIDRAFGDGGTG